MIADIIQKFDASKSVELNVFNETTTNGRPGHSLSTEEARALSWGGLQNTTLHPSNLIANQRAQIVDINNRHKSKTAPDNLGTYCTP